jgi:hypothetical protein
MIVFVFVHIPLIYWILMEFQRDNDTFISGFSIFLIIHFFLHVLFLFHEKNEFKDWVSWVIISGAALCGLLEVSFS